MSGLRTFSAFLLTGMIAVIFLPIGILAFLFSFTGLKKPMGYLAFLVAYMWSHIMIGISGCTLTIKGRGNIPRKGGICFVSNHGSIFDIILVLALIGRPFGFIAKKELAYIPFLNVWISILGGLFIDRKNPRKGLKTINKGILRLKAGSNIIIFPEGHRSRGQGLLPFRSGSFKLATQSGVPIVPIAIKGSYDVFEKYGRVNPCPVSIICNPPLYVEERPAENRRQILAEEVRSVIEKALAEESMEQSI